MDGKCGIYIFAFTSTLMPNIYNKKQNVFLMFRRGAFTGVLQATCVWNKWNWRPQIGKIL